MDYALDQGVNFWDTAEMYAVPPRKETYGRTEEIVGNWFKARGKRNKVILATKVAGPDQRFSYVRDGKPRLNRMAGKEIVPYDPVKLRRDQARVERKFWDKLRKYIRHVPFVDDLIAAYYCAMIASSARRSNGCAAAR